MLNSATTEEIQFRRKKTIALARITRKVTVCCVMFLCNQFAHSYTETEDDKLLYTSITDMVKLLNTVNQIHEKTDHLAQLYDKRLNHITEALLELKNAQMDKRTNILNPILLIKVGLTINRILKSKKHYVHQIENIKENLSALTLEKTRTNTLKMQGHLNTLFQLQDFYNLDTEQISNGILKESVINISLSALDCYEIGSWALEHQDAYHAKLWLNEAKRRLILKSADKTVRLEDILLKLANVYSVYKDDETANKIIENILEIDAFNEGAQQFQIVMKSYRTLYNIFLDKYRVSSTTYDWGSNFDGTLIQQLCSPKKSFHAEFDKLCYYQKVYAYYSIKVELLNTEPSIAIIHEIITDREINAFHRQAVLQNKVRLALNHSTIIKPKANGIIDAFREKLAKFAFPSVTLADSFLYTHFDIGEFHKLRYRPTKGQQDFFSNGNDGFYFTIFLNNVEGGGNVIFPLLNLSVIPQKGDALLWEFLGGKSDKRSIHTVCPVYAGNCTFVYALGHILE